VIHTVIFRARRRHVSLPREVEGNLREEASSKVKWAQPLAAFAQKLFSTLGLTL